MIRTERLFFIPPASLMGGRIRRNKNQIGINPDHSFAHDSHFMNKQTFFFCGIGGSGMSAIAQVLLHQGHVVRGSDRNYDQGQNADLYARLRALGIALFPQDGSGVDARVDALVVSSAVEPTILDVKAAFDQGIAIRKRAEVLADVFHRGMALLLAARVANRP